MKLLSMCSLVALSIATGSASAEWVKDEIKDQMRGISKTFYLTEAQEVNGAGPPIGLRVYDDKNGQLGVAFSLSQGEFNGCEDRLCKVELRFDEGVVKKELFSIGGSNIAVPTSIDNFVGALKLSRELVIEFGVGSHHGLQYRFNVEGLPVESNRSPEISIAGFDLGRKYSEHQIDLKKQRDEGGTACYSAPASYAPFGKQTVKKTSLCFSRGYLNTILIEPGSKAAYSEGVVFFNKAFGPMDKETAFPSWPKSDGKVLRRHTRDVGYLGDPKKAYDSVFVISDGVIDLISD